MAIGPERRLRLVEDVPPGGSIRVRAVWQAHADGCMDVTGDGATVPRAAGR